MKALKELSSLVKELNASNSTNDKIHILKQIESDDLVQLLMYIYNPYFQYNISYKNFTKPNNLVATEDVPSNIFEVLDTLRKRVVTGHDAIRLLSGYVKYHLEGNTQLIRPILDRDVKAKISVSTINKVFLGLIPTFDVALANKYENFSKNIDWVNDEWFWSRKLDGCRVIVRKENGNIKFFSRSGKEFHTLDVVKKQLESIEKDNFVLDGEICMVDKDGNEDFQSVISQIRRKDHTIENPMLYAFDILSLNEFDNKLSFRSLMKRYEELSELSSKNVSILDMDIVTSESMVHELSSTASYKGWEGIMLRKNSPYKGKRSNDLLKVKKMQDAEYIVTDIEVGPYRVLNKSTGCEEEIETMTNVLIMHKGNIVSVGSGFSLDQRRRYYEDSSLIIDKEMTVQYFEETKDKTGKYSLRFPVCKYVYELGNRTD